MQICVISAKQDHGCSHNCRTPSVANGLYLENVNDIVIQDVSIEYVASQDGSLPSYFGTCLVADERSSNVVTKNFNCVNGK